MSAGRCWTLQAVIFGGIVFTVAGPSTGPGQWSFWKEVESLKTLWSLLVVLGEDRACSFRIGEYLLNNLEQCGSSPNSASLCYEPFLYLTPQGTRHLHILSDRVMLPASSNWTLLKQRGFTALFSRVSVFFLADVLGCVLVMSVQSLHVLTGSSQNSQYRRETDYIRICCLWPRGREEWYLDCVDGLKFCLLNLCNPLIACRPGRGLSYQGQWSPAGKSCPWRP